MMTTYRAKTKVMTEILSHDVTLVQDRKENPKNPNYKHTMYTAGSSHNLLVVR